MTSTLDDTDTDWLTLIDYEKEIICQNVAVPCDRLAEWSLTAVCCNKSLLMCTKHKDNELWWMKQKKIVICMFCKSAGLDLKIVPL